MYSVPQRKRPRSYWNNPTSDLPRASLFEPESYFLLGPVGTLLTPCRPSARPRTPYPQVPPEAVTSPHAAPPRARRPRLMQVRRRSLWIRAEMEAGMAGAWGGPPPTPDPCRGPPTLPPYGGTLPYPPNSRNPVGRGTSRELLATGQTDRLGPTLPAFRRVAEVRNATRSRRTPEERNATRSRRQHPALDDGMQRQTQGETPAPVPVAPVPVWI